MAKKLTKAQIAKNPTKAINSGKMEKKSGEVIGPGKIVARLIAKKSVKKALKNAKKSKPLAEPKPGVRVKYNKQAMENAIIKQSRGLKSPDMSPSRPANRPLSRPNLIEINTNPTKPKGVFGPLKKKVEKMDTPANRAKAKANARGLKAANKPLSKGNAKRIKNSRNTPIKSFNGRTFNEEMARVNKIISAKNKSK